MLILIWIGLKLQMDKHHNQKFMLQQKSQTTPLLGFLRNNQPTNNKAARNGIGMVGMGMARKNTGMAGMEILDLHSEAKFPFQKAQFLTKFTRKV